jgi:hypothetical protein
MFTVLREHFKKMGDEQKQFACAKLAAKYSKRIN